jgi:hypothetical protein
MERRGPALPPPGLMLAAPTMAKLGSEISVGVMLLSQSRPGQTEIDLAYDPGMLAPVGKEGSAGRIVLTFPPQSGGPARSDVRFRVIAPAPGSTQIRAENAIMQDPSRGSVSLASPPPQTVQLVP